MPEAAPVTGTIAPRKCEENAPLTAFSSSIILVRSKVIMFLVKWSLSGGRRVGIAFRRKTIKQDLLKIDYALCERKNKADGKWRRMIFACWPDDLEVVRPARRLQEAARSQTAYERAYE
jgi:hypothetical protein